MATLSSTGNGTTSPRRQRYTRASTTSVTQLLSDGYSSFINRLTRRGPSEKSDPIGETKLNATKSRYDDKLLGNKNSVLTSVRRYENNNHISPYTSSFASGGPRKLNDDRVYSSYLGATKPRPDASPLRTISGIYGLGRNDSFRKANKSSPIIKLHPLKETNNNIDSTIIGLGTTRSRLEDKYSSVLDRIAIQKKEKAKKDKEDRDKTLEPEPALSRGLMRSLTTAVFGENSFKRNKYSQETNRDKTPFRNTTERRFPSNHKYHDKADHKNGIDESLNNRFHNGKDRNSIYRRHQRRSLRAEKSETSEKRIGKLSLRPVDIDIHPGPRDLISPPQQKSNENSSISLALTKTPASSPARQLGRQKQIYFPSSDEDDDKTPVGDRILSERETRRKEIQSLIMKYAHIDEAYGRIREKGANDEAAGQASVKKVEPLGVGSVVALPPELRGRHRALRPRHLVRRAATPPVSTS